MIEIAPAHYKYLPVHSTIKPIPNPPGQPVNKYAIKLIFTNSHRLPKQYRDQKQIKRSREES